MGGGRQFVWTRGLAEIFKLDHDHDHDAGVDNYISNIRPLE